MRDGRSFPGATSADIRDALSAHQRAGRIEPPMPAIAQLTSVGLMLVVNPSTPAEELVKILNQPDVRERIVSDGSEPVGNTPEELD